MTVSILNVHTVNQSMAACTTLVYQFLVFLLYIGSESSEPSLYLCSPSALKILGADKFPMEYGPPGKIHAPSFSRVYRKCHTVAVWRLSSGLARLISNTQIEYISYMFSLSFSRLTTLSVTEHRRPFNTTTPSIAPWRLAIFNAALKYLLLWFAPSHRPMHTLQIEPCRGKNMT